MKFRCTSIRCSQQCVIDPGDDTTMDNARCPWEFGTDCRWVPATQPQQGEGVNSSAQSGPTNTTQAAIALELLKRVSAEFHQGEEFDQPSHYANIVIDIDNYLEQLSAVR